jgi:F420-non-reducing hydrogenase iron-sulfur subunit
MSEAPQTVSSTGFEPRIVGILCNWCAYAGADAAGAAQQPFAPNVHVVRVMCSGRVDPQLVLETLVKGADGVLVLGCHPGDCHYKEQNYRALQRHGLLLRLLEQAGVDRRRCRFDYVSANDAEKYRRVVNEMTETVRALGPLAGPPRHAKEQ